MKIEGRIKQLDIHTPGGFSGRLFKNAHFAFNYGPEATVENQVSITMGLRNESYTRGALFPIFEMNLPEGYVRHYVIERLRKFAPIDDMLFLALSGNNGIGRLSYKTKLIDVEASAAITLESIIASGNSTALFADLVETYLLHTSVGVSGVQPKVVIPEDRGSLALPTLIVKSGNAEYPNIAINEYVCMSIAKEAGLKTPEFWNTEDRQLFIMRRFDILDSGEKLGMEDFSVLMGKSGDKKYEGRYETLLRAANLYEVDVTEMFEQIVLSLVIGNGDAHLKNFAILYENVNGPFRLSPVYDVVCTRPYGDETTALSINKSRNYPSRSYLEKMGKQFGVREPGKIMDRIGDAVGLICRQYSEIMAQLGAQDVQTSIIKNRDLVLTRGSRLNGTAT
jgi:serine/threonine-protein kinase HipA